MEDWQLERNKIIGLGENSFQKSYYPELQDKLDELNVSHSNLENILNSMSDLVIIHDSEGQFLYLNQSALDILNIEKTKLFNYSVLDIIADKGQIWNLKKIWKAIESGKSSIVDNSIVTLGTAQKYPVQVSVSPLNWYNSPALVAVIRDFTERKRIEQNLIDAKRHAEENEAKYKMLSENSSDCVFMCKANLLIYVNQSMLNVFGYEKSEMEGKDLTQLINPEHQIEFENFLEDRRSSCALHEFECSFRTKVGATLLFDLFLNYNENEDIYYGVMHDITERHQREQRNILKAIIKTEEKEKADFSKELHDGLGPLLSVIKMYLQWSIRPNSKKPSKEIIKQAEDVLEEALTAVKEISNKLSPHILANHGLTSAIQTFTNKLHTTDTVQVFFESNLDRRIAPEIEVALYRAVIEFTNNSIKYAHAKEIHISLNDTGNFIFLRYKDDGKGFDMEKTLSEGKGLGLFNQQNRIKNIGGEIKMTSNKDQGVDYQIKVAMNIE